MNNVGIRLRVSPWDPDGAESWQKVFNVNVFGYAFIEPRGISLISS